MFKFKKKKFHHYFFEKLLMILGVVLIWRGIWYLLDYFDIYFFGKSHWETSLAGVVIGFFLLYFPDKDLEEL